MTIDPQEVAKFSQHAAHWWDTEGPLKTLHDINPVRLNFIQDNVLLTNKRVLDVGCGGGILCEAMAECGAEVTGLDVEPEAIAAACTHAAAHEKTIHYVCQPIEALEIAPFDVITCMEMLEHVADPAIVIQHCARLLKPDGYLFLSTINRTLKAYATVIVAAEYLLGLLPRQTHDFDKFIKPSELASMLRHEGLELVSMAGMAYQPLTRVVSLETSVEVNYLLACRKG